MGRPEGCGGSREPNPPLSYMSYSFYRSYSSVLPLMADLPTHGNLSGSAGSKSLEP
jgi:hypothetical protein